MVSLGGWKRRMLEINPEKLASEEEAKFAD